MAKEVRLGVAGLTHGHVWGLIDAAKKVEGVALVAVADRTPLIEKATGFERTYSDWQEMLDSESLDVLIITSDNIESTEIAIAALGKGIHCLVEKAMAANAVDADRMLEAKRASGASLMINWPLAWNAWLPELKKQIEAGTIGHAFHLRYRNGHFGPKEIGCDEYFVGWLYDEAKNGGGAIADFGSYGAVLCRYLFGMPEAVMGVRHNTTKDYPVPDDHAVAILKYDKLDCFIEGTWATAVSEEGANPVVNGKDATLGVVGGKLKKYVRGHEPEELETPAFAQPNPVAYFLECIESGNSPEGILDPEVCADACRILDAFKASADTLTVQKL